MTHREAFREFVSRESVLALWATLCLLVGVRSSAGGFSLPDLLVISAVFVGHHVLEWVAHRFVLHGPRGLFLSRYHRAHHARPTDLRFIFMPLGRALGLLATVASGVGLAWGVRAGLSCAVMVTTMGLAYEWLHFLSHRPVKPATRLGRKLKKHHMLHHFKNERYWYGVTARYVDTLLRTNPTTDTVGHQREP